MTSRLYCGDNLDVLREPIPDESVDLILSRRFGLFVMKGLPTKGKRDEAVSQLTIEFEFGRFPALQFVTLAELMMGIKPKLPPLISPVKKAARIDTRASHRPGSQGSLL